MNVFRSFTYSNLMLRNFNALKKTSLLFSGFKASPFEFRQFSSLQNALSPSPLNNFKCSIPLVMPSCGLKTKGRLQLRCKDCYFERKDGDMYVFCKSYGRHKQKLLKSRNKKYNWILSYAFATKWRPY